MISNRQLAYLDAMDIGVWSLREPATTAASAPVTTVGLKLGPGSGGVLLICAADTDSATRLANDISRALGSLPVWAWPHADTRAVKLTGVVEENLFTTVAIFGNQLATQFFDGELPASLNSAKLVLLPAMQDLQNRPEARRALWATLCRSGMVSTN
jgi:DNA polymerase III psi subunit